MNSLATIAATAGTRLKERRQTVAVVETSGGGLVSAALLALPGASAYYRGGVVSYTAAARDAFLGTDATFLAGTRSSTEECALRLARTVRERLGTTWAVAETGAAGPTGNRYGDAAGHTCVAVSGPVERSLTVETRVADREANMWMFTRAAIGLLTDCIEAAK